MLQNGKNSNETSAQINIKTKLLWAKMIFDWHIYAHNAEMEVEFNDYDFNGLSGIPWGW